MSPIRVTFRRTFGRLIGQYTTLLIAAVFCAVSSVLVSFNLNASEGARLSLSVVWATSLAMVLPFLASFLAMDVWSDERASNRLDLLLSTPVRERDFVGGKFLGVYVMLVLVIFLSYVTQMIGWLIFAPRLVANLSWFSFVPGFFALALQGATWCAVACAASALCRRGAIAAVLSILVLVGLPRGFWFALLAWAPHGRTAIGEMPLDVHAYDLASGLLSFATMACYLFAILFALFIASKVIAATRLAGRSWLGGRFHMFVLLLLASACFVSSATLVRRFDFTIDLPLSLASHANFSTRTKHVLVETHGEILVTIFLSRKDQQFRPISQFFRALAKVSESQSSARFTIRYVDPNWDFGAAERLVRAGAQPGSIIVERAHRMETIALAEGFDERACLSAIHRLSMPAQRRTIYWTCGHGETSFAAYENFGMSTIARDIAREGYRNCTLDLAANEVVPSDCALILVAGAKEDFSRIEAQRLDAYLRQGGRLFVLLATADAAGITPLLSRWGIRPTRETILGARTLSGSDVIASAFAEHAVTSPLVGAQIVLEKPVSFSPSAAVETGGSGADRIEFTSLATVNETCLVAMAERGVGTGEDLQIRPTRIVALGDASFVMNGALATRANANRDFFLNCLAYLAGVDNMTEVGDEPGRLISGMDRASRVDLILYSAGVFPFGFFVLGGLILAWRRRQK